LPSAVARQGCVGRIARSSGELATRNHELYAGWLLVEQLRGVYLAHDREEAIELLDETDARERIARSSEEADRLGRLNLTAEPGTDALQLFLSDAGRVPLLTAAQEVSLAKRIELGDLGAKREIRAGAPRSGTGRRSAVCRSSWTG
jgi:Sigma-70 factor, region 1.2